MNNGKALTAIAALILILGATPLAAYAADGGQQPLGPEIAGRFNEIISAHRTDIDNFITEHRVLMEENQEEKLNIIEEKNEALRTAIDEAKAAREELIAKLEAGEITEEDFAAEMRALASGIANAAKSMGALGEVMGGVGKELAEELKLRAQGISGVMMETESEMYAEGLNIAEEMSGRDLPVPDNLPGKRGLQFSGSFSNMPENIPPTGLPEQAQDEVPPTELPEEVPDELLPIELPGDVPEGVPRGAPKGP
jgi:hypothetical protein